VKPIERFASVVAGIVVSIGASAPPAAACQLMPAIPAPMPVHEVTLFKDGHAFVLQSGRMATNDAGDVTLDQLPSPVLGTFWPFASDRKARLRSVTSGRSDVRVERTALDLRQLVLGNAGAEVVVTEIEGPTYKARIIGVPARRPDERRRDPPAGGDPSGVRTVEPAGVALLETEDGTKVVRLDRIRDVRFTGAYRSTVAEDDVLDRMTLRLDWEGAPQKEAEVGLVYLQKGLRWIPSYRIAIDGAGRATVTLQATIVNELVDLADVTANLVIGVPSFPFEDTPDPIGLQRAVAELSRSFRNDARTAFAFSNAIMTQQLASPRSHVADDEPAAAGPDLGPEVAGSGAHEDLFVFTLEHVSLKKGERAVVPMGEFSMKYRDVYALDLQFAPPPELWRNLDGSRQTELARVFATPRFTHRIRLANGSAVPLTTAPALVLRDGRLLAQGLMTYAAPGAESELTITTVSDLAVSKEEQETARVPDAATWQGEKYGRVDLSGALTLTSYRKEPVEVEITRHVLGNVATADHGGRKERVNVLEDAGVSGAALPYWWSAFSWPWWWSHLNGVGRVHWTVTLQPRQPMALGYTWNYYWR
jgi:hypothetical protein